MSGLRGHRHDLNDLNRIVQVVHTSRKRRRTVYLARAKDGRCYAGLTSNVGNRASAHGRKRKDNVEFEQLFYDERIQIDHTQARFAEQFMINNLGGVSGTEAFPKPGLLINKINSLVGGGTVSNITVMNQLNWFHGKALTGFVSWAQTKLKCP